MDARIREVGDMIISNKFCSSITPLRNHLRISKEYSDSPMALGETGQH
jgi:hypothetical protein